MSIVTTFITTNKEIISKKITVHGVQSKIVLPKRFQGKLVVIIPENPDKPVEKTETENGEVTLKFEDQLYFFKKVSYNNRTSSIVTLPKRYIGCNSYVTEVGELEDFF